MVTKFYTACTIGLEVRLVEVELDLSPSLPMIIVVGLPDKAVQESKERIRSSLRQSGLEFPLGKVTINLAPADVLKTGTSYDLPIGAGILQLIGSIPNEDRVKQLYLGELALDGSLRPVSGCLSICLWASKHGFKEVFLPKKNASEASMVKNLSVYAIENLSELIDHLNKTKILSPVPPLDFSKLRDIETEHDLGYLNKHDMAYVRGQSVAKRAMEIAASGGHNLMLVGQPGSGKTLLARSYPTILPTLAEDEILEITQIYSAAGLLKDGKLLLQRPFRGPHHTASHVALIGGGSKLRPGEISLAHRGVLFLDEFPEFTRESLEALRQPLEDGFVTISRASGSVVYPSRFYLLAAANPTPSGYQTTDQDNPYANSDPRALAKYRAKFSGPILDRIDLHVEVNRPQTEELHAQTLSEKSVDIRKRVQLARNIQTARFKNMGIFTNSEMGLPLINRFCQLNSETKELLNKAIETYKLTARGYIRILKLSRTIADLDNSATIESRHLAESLQYRGRWLAS